MKPTIVVVAYKRYAALNRLLFSLKTAYYSEIPNLVISIDGGGSKKVVQVANTFSWSGQKEIVVHPKNLGLKAHIIRCASLTEKYEQIILLEEDLFVARDFYSYAEKALTYFGSDDRIAGISLYQYEYIEVDDLPFVPLVDANDNYFIQMASSWGQAWTSNQWKNFLGWYNRNKEWDPSDKRLPKDVATWGDSSWKKFFIKYLIDTNRFFVYPRISLSTNFGDEGENNGYKNSLHQVNILVGKKKVWYFSSLEEGIKYDVHFNLLDVPKKLVRPIYMGETDINLRPFELNMTEGLMKPECLEKVQEKHFADKFHYRFKFNLSDYRIMKIKNELPPLRKQVVGQIKYFIKKKFFHN